MVTGPNPTIPPRPRSPPLKLMTVGKASGKRTLAEVMDQDIAVKKKKKRSPSSAPTSPKVTSSKFFGAPVRRASSSAKLGHQAGVSSPRTEKENIIDVEGLPDDGDSLVTRGRVDSEIEDLHSDPVEQEDGYISPTPSMSKDADDLSSPVRPPSRRYQDTSDDRFDFDVDPISSPPPEDSPENWLQPIYSSQSVRSSKVLVEPSKRHLVVQKELVKLDLRDSFGGKPSSEIDCAGYDEVDSCPPTPSLLTPDELLIQNDHDQDRTVPLYDLELDDPEQKELIASASRTKIVAAGWRDRWALDSSRTMTGAGPHSPRLFLQRRETNITPKGRHRIFRPPHPKSPLGVRIPGSSRSTSRSFSTPTVNPIRGRKSLIFFGEAVNSVDCTH